MGRSRIYTDEERRIRAKEKCKKWQKDNPEKVSIINKRWRDANPKQARDIINHWRKANKEKVGLYSSQYYHDNKDRMKKTLYTWRKTNLKQFKTIQNKPAKELQDRYIIVLLKKTNSYIENPSILPSLIACKRNMILLRRKTNKYENNNNSISIS